VIADNLLRELRDAVTFLDVPVSSALIDEIDAYLANVPKDREWSDIMSMDWLSLATEVRILRSKLMHAYDRIGRQSELLTRKAEKKT
jgi:protoheme ferro-lyase